MIERFIIKIFMFKIFGYEIERLKSSIWREIYIIIKDTIIYIFLAKNYRKILSHIDYF